ncbi:hypothetical protein CEUSTIGMA_g13256.t1 [Chlamydomonas eustigma]|uniref:50S ribosomal protein L17 n=1 Tax=Chlamydomonas eustigma TaxID=1157962 RepID=A0A250XRW8_9CHLO|nr:hypothetical protein CEUSTIGMA_g13256.t1 [Chlamydomonas eustigma]|eukprot:GAX85841.1 hypothetical protein CEUSTIGMA_g13256.t1 [Chlamydomonas eustigma]
MRKLLKSLPRLARPWSHRISLLKTQLTQLLEKERIRTTLPKALALRRVADKAIGLGKAGTRKAWDKAKGMVRTDSEIHKLFTTLALRYKDREGGYTRVCKTGFRERDAAPMAFIELVDRVGELRPARQPKSVSPFLPFTVQAYLHQQKQMADQQK